MVAAGCWSEEMTLLLQASGTGRSRTLPLLSVPLSCDDDVAVLLSRRRPSELRQGPAQRAAMASFRTTKRMLGQRHQGPAQSVATVPLQGAGSLRKRSCLSHL